MLNALLPLQRIIRQSLHQVLIDLELLNKVWNKKSQLFSLHNGMGIILYSDLFYTPKSLSHFSMIIPLPLEN